MSIPEPAETQRIDPLSSPPRKQQRLVTCDPPEQGALNTGLPIKYMSPLDLLISDKTKEVTDEKKKVMEKEKVVQELSAKYGKQAGTITRNAPVLIAIGAKDTTGSIAHTKVTLANQQKFVET